MSMEIDKSGFKIGGLWLHEGITKVNVWSMFYASFVTIGILTVITTSTSFVLNETLKVPIDQQGEISGILVLINEVAQICIFSAVGILADRIGRRPVFACGLIGMGLGYLLYPYAGSIFELSVYRAVYAMGLAAATGMLGTVVADYPQEVSRGKWVALIGVLNGLGVVSIAGLFGVLLNGLAEGGMDQLTAGKTAHLYLAIFCVFSAIIVARGLKKGTPVKKEEQPDFMHLAKAGFLQAKNPRIALSYASAFVARSDLVILGTFTVLWGTTAGVSQGMEPAQAAFRGTMIFVTAQTAALAWAPIIGFLMDRLNRVTGLAVCMVCASIGYLSMMLVGDPLRPGANFYFILLGIGQISAFFGATTLIGQEAPKAERGAVVGMFNMVGAVGILICSYFGGLMFDAIDPSAPFVLIGVLNAVVLVASMIIRRIDPGPMPEKNLDPLIAPIKALFSGSK